MRRVNKPPVRLEGRCALWHDFAAVSNKSTRNRWYATLPLSRHKVGGGMRPRPELSLPASPNRLWPSSIMPPTDYARLRELLHRPLLDRLQQLGIPDDRLDGLCAAYLPLAAWIDRRKTSVPMVVGINGAQGSGKSTLCGFVALVLTQAFGYRVASFSIDDLYLTRAERRKLAQTVHPMLMTRGVPGTHDVQLGLAVIDALLHAGPRQSTLIPAFDKAMDDRSPRADWPAFIGGADIVIIEGWCLGARPQDDPALAVSVNELEETEDADGTWRRYVNEQLKDGYATLLARLDALIMLKVPSMASVYAWRALQERKLAATLDPDRHHRIMDAAALRRFIMHYERLTLAMLAEMPQRADVTLGLDAAHRFNHIQLRH